MTVGGDRSLNREDGDLLPMERCPACGRRRVRSGRCHACGQTATAAPARFCSESLPSFPMDQGTGSPLDEIVEGRFGLRREDPSSVPAIHRSTPPVRGAEPSVSAPLVRAADGGGSSVSGRVLYLSPMAYEPMDFDPWRWVAIPAWGLVLLATPVAGTLAAWELGGPLAALVVAVVLLMVLRYVFSNRLLDSWHLVSALNGRHHVESMPVQIARVRRWEGGEAQLRFKGHFANGAVMEGDRIEATGRWRGGVFVVSESLCERTGARVAPRQPRAKGFALAGLAVLAGLALWILIAGASLSSGLRSSGPSSPSPIELPIPATPSFL